MNKNLLTKIDARGLATVTMNRPALHNAFDDLLITDLTSVLQRLESEPLVRVVLLAASGKSFSAGADLNWMRRMADYSREENLADSMALAGLMSTLNGLSKPTIALVQGAAYGGGVGLVACCDIALATDRAAFCLSEVKLGLIPAVISPYVVEAIGSRAARRYFLTAERFDAVEARHLGLIHELVAADDLHPRGEALAELLIQNGPAALAAAKNLVAVHAKAPIDDAMIADTARRIAEIRSSDEGKDGVSAFLQKRPPAWVKG
ncbi:MAG: enoyl-CoA hydratase/isomerase family protein [Desulfuromonadales bacterium]|nr:enoyl-CoA hydratase/isomerase family protein [Desulfuromonadales bacterium]